MKADTESMDKGVQPLDAIMTELNLKNHDLVECSQEGLSHKMVAKGRKGRRLTLNIQYKILNALNAIAAEPSYRMDNLFNYSGKR